MDFKIILTNKRNECLVYENYKYRYYREKLESVTWRCTKRDCSATVETDISKEAIVKFKNGHNHIENSPETIVIQSLRNSCKRKASEDHSTRPNKIIRSVLGENSSNEATYMDIANIRKAMYKQRRKQLPSIPVSRADALRKLIEYTPTLLTNNDERFCFVDEMKDMVLFTCNTNLRFLCLENPLLFADGTFDYSAKHFYQQYTLHGLKNGLYIQIAYFLLPSKRKDTYVDMWELLKEVCDGSASVTLNVSNITLDFEKASHNAVKEVFPNVTVKGCNFHLSQCWFRKIQQHQSLLAAYKNKQSDVGNWLKYFFGLPFLPADEVGDGFADLMSIKPDESTEITNFTDYLVDNYLDGETAGFPPSVWAEEPSQNPKTTNGPEAFHRHFNASFYAPHPSTFVLFETLKMIQVETYAKIETIRRGHHINKNSRHLCDSTHYLWNEYLSGKMERIDYLKKLGYRYQGKRV